MSRLDEDFFVCYFNFIIYLIFIKMMNECLLTKINVTVSYQCQELYFSHFMRTNT